VEIRPVRPEEVERAGAVVVAAYEALPDHHMTGGYAAELADVARRSVEAEVLVAVTEGGDIVGCVTFVPDASSPWAELVEEGESAIRMLGVIPAGQGRGVGHALLDACIQRARAAGSDSLFLHSTPWMEAAHRLYLRAGFVRIPERDWRPFPEVPLLAFCLALKS
jgi:ribosomal protein S18 acetylase RimI-like enzyme